MLEGQGLMGRRVLPTYKVNVTMTFKPLIKKYIGVIIFPRPTHL
jgi:hypothetical protein